jgi:hypothetical protein
MFTSLSISQRLGVVYKMSDIAGALTKGQEVRCRPIENFERKKEKTLIDILKNT